MKRVKAAGLSAMLFASGVAAADPAPSTGPASLPPGLLPVNVRVPEAPADDFPAELFKKSFPLHPERVPTLSNGYTDTVWSPAKPAAVMAPAPFPVIVSRPEPVPPPKTVARPPALVPVRNDIPVPQSTEITVPAIPTVSVPVVEFTKPTPIPQRRLEGLDSKFVADVPTPEVKTPPISEDKTPQIPQTMPGPKTVVPVPQTMPGPKTVVPVPPVGSTAPAPRTTPTPPTPGQPLPPPQPTPNVWGGPNSPSTPASTPTPAADSEGELQPAPADVLYSPGYSVPYHHGTFGSKPISISRDYPPLTDLFSHRGHRAVNEAGLAGDRTFAQFEYLLWWVNRDSIPILATTSNDGGDGFLGQPGTVPLIGPGQYGSSQPRSGFRVRVGTWLDDCGTCGVDGSFFFLGQTSRDQTLTPNEFTIITRPVFAPNGGGFEFGEVVSAPGVSVGALSVKSESFLWGADVNARKSLCRQCDRNYELFAGFRFLALDENIAITENLQALPGGTDIPGTLVAVQDRFDTRNRFYGAQIGGLYNRQWGKFDLYARGSIALGDTWSQVQIDGFQQVLPPGATTPTQFTGGLLATPTNIGTYTRNAFSAVPEVTLNLGYMVTPGFKLYVGYNMIYWPNVLRPGGEIDRVVNVSFVPNPPVGVPASTERRPAATFHETDLLIQGLQIGAEWRY